MSMHAEAGPPVRQPVVRQQPVIPFHQVAPVQKHHFLDSMMKAFSAVEISIVYPCSHPWIPAPTPGFWVVVRLGQVADIQIVRHELKVMLHPARRLGFRTCPTAVMLIHANMLESRPGGGGGEAA